MTDSATLLNPYLERRSFVELGARQRAKALLDVGSFRELLDPFQRLMSPWLARQGVVPQADDGVVIAKGSMGGLPVVIAAIEGVFQGGSLGGTGTVFGNVSNAGQVNPGNALGILTIQGNYTQTAPGSLAIQLGSQYSQLEGDGGIALGGPLQVSLVNGFTPHLGDTFTIVKNGDQTEVSFAYEKEFHLMGPAWLTLKYAGQSRPGR